MCTARLPTIATRCQHQWGPSSEQVWTGFQSWPSEVTSRGSNASWVMFTWGSPNRCWHLVATGEVQRIIGNGHMVTLNRMRGRHSWKYYLPTTSLADGKNLVARLCWDDTGRKCSIMNSYFACFKQFYKLKTQQVTNMSQLSMFKEV